MNILNFSEAEAFLMLADCGGFGAAARALRVTQSTVSRRIAGLEARLGQRLVERTTRHVALTEAGLAYAGELRDVLSRLKSAEARVQSQAAEPEGVLRVTLPIAFGRICVLPCLARLVRRYPRLRTEIDLSDRYVDLRDGDIDVAVRFSDAVPSAIEARRIGSFRVRACAAPDYARAHPPMADLAEATRHEWLVARTSAARVSLGLEREGRPLEADLAPRMIVSNVTALAALTLSGAGVALLPDYVVAPDLAAGRLVDMTPGLALQEIDVFAVYARARKTLSRVTAFLDELAQIPEVGFTSAREGEPARG